MLIRKKVKPETSLRRGKYRHKLQISTVKAYLKFTHYQIGDNEQIGSKKENNIVLSFRTHLAFALMKLSHVNKAQREHLSGSLSLNRRTDTICTSRVLRSTRQSQIPWWWAQHSKTEPRILVKRTDGKEFIKGYSHHFATVRIKKTPN